VGWRPPNLNERTRKALQRGDFRQQEKQGSLQLRGRQQTG